MAASAVANIPIVEIADPPIHLGSGDLFWFVDHARQDSGIVHACFPKFKSQPMVSSYFSREFIHPGFCNTEDVFGDDAEARHTFYVSPLAEAAQLGQRAVAGPGFLRGFRTFFRSRGGL